MTSVLPLEVIGLGKEIAGKTILEDFTWQVGPGEVHALIGRNGAGKSTLIKICAGLYVKSSGSVKLFNVDAEKASRETLQRVGYVSQSDYLPKSASLAELEVLCRGLSNVFDDSVLHRVYRTIGVDRSAIAGELSPGQRRLVSCALTLATQPELVLLDEPAANLDAIARREFMEEIGELLATTGSSVVLATHLLADVERLADYVCIVAKGRVAVADSLERLKGRVVRVRAQFEGEVPESLCLPGTLRECVGAREITATVIDWGPQADVLLAARGCSFETIGLSLEEIFVAYCRLDTKEAWTG